MILYERGQLAEALQLLYSALAQPLRKWTEPDFFYSMKEQAEFVKKGVSLRAGEWTCLDSPGPPARCFAASVQAGSRLYIFGGGDEGYGTMHVFVAQSHHAAQFV